MSPLMVASGMPRLARKGLRQRPTETWNESGGCSVSVLATLAARLFLLLHRASARLGHLAFEQSGRGKQRSRSASKHLFGV